MQKWQVYVVYGVLTRGRDSGRAAAAAARPRPRPRPRPPPLRTAEAVPCASGPPLRTTTHR